MKYTCNVQATPNPNALKFILNVRVVQQGNATYRDESECGSNELAKALFALAHVNEVFFNDNYITVTQDGRADWDELEAKVQTVIMENIEAHNPDISGTVPSAAPRAKADNADIEKIEALLDQNIRPYLQMDGGDVQVVAYADKVLKISYQGACGGCPGAAFGTLRAIENVLREQYDKDLVVELARS